MTAALALAAVLAVVAALLVARPFLRDPEPASDRLDELTERERRRLELSEERDRALAALKELEFDHRTGKVADEHYRETVGPMRLRAAEALRALERFDAAAGGDESRMVEIPDPVPPGEPTPPDPVPEPAPEPYPPPDEADPPEPARVPEPGPLGVET